MSSAEFLFVFVVALFLVIIWGLTRSKKEQNEMYRKQFMAGFERDFYFPEEIEEEKKD